MCKVRDLVGGLNTNNKLDPSRDNNKNAVYKLGKGSSVLIFRRMLVLHFKVVRIKQFWTKPNPSYYYNTLLTLT